MCLYQKDGPGILKRMYLDRIYDFTSWTGLEQLPIKRVPPFVCGACREHLGIPIVYAKENRLAYRLFVGAVTKAIVKSLGRTSY